MTLAARFFLPLSVYWANEKGAQNIFTLFYQQNKHNFNRVNVPTV